MQKANGVVGCIWCGKPCALVGDEIPDDYTCPWCRAMRAPAVFLLYARDAGPEKSDTMPSTSWPDEQETKS